jgi:ATP-dependent DNA helicase PIF1
MNEINACINFTEGQKKIYDLVINERKNVFITSSAGCGKTFIIKEIYKVLSKTANVGITSLTGISAVVLGGSTVHSYLGIRLGDESCEKLCKRIKYNKFMANRWRRLDVLIIDEISMLSIELFEKLEQIARIMRSSDRVFGGIQLLFSGDFLQLPTVKSDKFCFETPLWNKCFTEPCGKTFLLTEIVRQKDATFARVLNKIRIGEVDDECKDVLEARVIKYFSQDGLIPTMLYPTNYKVDKTNTKYYNELAAPEYTYKIEYQWHSKKINKEYYESLVKLPYELRLKAGAQVMYLVNNPDLNLVNGSRGVVKGFVEGFPLVFFSDGSEKIITPECINIEENDEILLSYMQLPIKLAWAISIHKSQGSSMDLVRIDLKNIFEYGQFYVALSRCKTLDGLYIRNLVWGKVKTHPEALHFYKNL